MNDFKAYIDILKRDDAKALENIPDVMCSMDHRENQEGYSILHYAIEFKSKRCMNYLIGKYPELLYIKTQLEDIPLHTAIIFDVDIIDSYSDIVNIIEEERNEDGSSPIHIAATYNREKLLKKLLRISSKNINEPDNLGKTPLYLAIENMADWELIGELLEMGADPFYKDPSPKTKRIYMHPELEITTPYELAKREYNRRCGLNATDDYTKVILKTIKWIENHNTSQW